MTNEQNSHFQLAEMLKMNIENTHETSTLIKLSSLEMLIHSIKSGNRVILL